MATTIVGRGVTSREVGPLLQPVYFTTRIMSDGTVQVDNKPYVSWNAATVASKDACKGTTAVYMIADQIKAFQKRLARASKTD